MRATISCLNKIFLYTNIGVPFAFQVIPVDILAKVIASNAVKMTNGEGHPYLRPVLEKPVTLEEAIRLTGDRGTIRPGTLEDLMAAVPEPEKLA